MTIAYGIGGNLNVAPGPIFGKGAPPANFKGTLGQQWIDSIHDTVYIYTNKDWVAVAGSSPTVTELTGNTGGPISPSSGNINIIGNAQSTFAGSGNTLALTQTPNGFPITPYVVGPVGKAGYQTIQSAVDAAHAAGGGYIFVQDGIYNENLTLYDKIVINGTIVLSAFMDTAGVFINGTHTPPLTGAISFNYVDLSSTTDIFFSNAAGSCQINVSNAAVVTTSGYLFNLLNWTGILGCFNINCTGTGGQSNGTINNAGGSLFICYECGLGWGTGQTMQTAGPVVLESCDVRPPWTCNSGTVIDASYNLEIVSPITFSGNSTAICKRFTFLGGTSAAITMSSSGSVLLEDCIVQSTHNPAIAGSGAGTLTLGNITFTNNSNLASTLTTAFAPTIITSPIYSNTAGATPQIVNGHTGQVAFTDVINAAAVGTLVMTNAMISSTSVIVASVSCATVGAALVINTITPGSGTVTFKVTNLGGTNTGTNILINFWALN